MIRMPLSRPILTNVLLGAIGVVFLIETIAGGSTSTATLVKMGAQVNSLVATGGYWRLLAAMFLHIGLMHIAFNGWALFTIGRDVEAFYGSGWFIATYFIAGLAGNVAYYLLGSDVLSAGASGAIFGLIGAEAAFFVRNRPLFGRFGRDRLANLAVLIGINLVFGFTVQGINNFAHLGGLLSGFLLGLALAPRYRFAWHERDGVPVGMLQDGSSTRTRLFGIGLAMVLLVGGVMLGNQHWATSPAVLRQQAQAAIDAHDLTGAQALLERAIAVDSSDVNSYYSLGVLQAQQNDLTGAVQSLETVLRLVPDQPDAELILGLVYFQQGRAQDARVQLERFLAQESTGQRADYARQVLAGLPE